jgi:hypothetical protein
MVVRHNMTGAIPEEAGARLSPTLARSRHDTASSAGSCHWPRNPRRLGSMERFPFALEKCRFRPMAGREKMLQNQNAGKDRDPAPDENADLFDHGLPSFRDSV